MIRLPCSPFYLCEEQSNEAISSLIVTDEIAALPAVARNDGPVGLMEEHNDEAIVTPLFVFARSKATKQSHRSSLQTRLPRSLRSLAMTVVRVATLPGTFAEPDNSITFVIPAGPGSSPGGIQSFHAPSGFRVKPGMTEKGNMQRSRPAVARIDTRVIVTEPLKGKVPYSFPSPRGRG